MFEWFDVWYIHTYILYIGKSIRIRKRNTSFPITFCVSVWATSQRVQIQFWRMAYSWKELILFYMYYYYWIFYRFILLFILQEKEWNLNKFVELFILFFWLFWNLIFKFLVWPYELLRLSFVFPTTVIIDVKNKRETRVAWLTEEKLFVCLCAWLFIAAVVGGSVPPCESKKQNWQVVYDWILKFCVRPVFHENECCPSPISRRLISFPSHWLSCVIPCRFFFFLFSPMIFTVWLLFLS